jgi:hypothetical protein
MMGSHTLKSMRADRVIRLGNVRCPYCGVVLNSANRNRDHAIGRAFVPKGMLENRWNLLLWSCVDCNTWKSDLEDDISAITMQPRPHGPSLDQREHLRADAARKGAGSISRLTGKPVDSSQEQLVVESRPQPGVRFTFKLTAPPQIDPERIAQLAAAHVAAFFFFVTYDQLARAGVAPFGEFKPLAYAFRSDWGNPVQRGFIEAVLSWPPYFLGGTAEGLFKIVLRKAPDGRCWSWAVEWNENLRVIGFFGDADRISEIVDALPQPSESMIEQPDGSTVGARVEQALAPDEDRMFYWSDGEA